MGKASKFRITLWFKVGAVDEPLETDGELAEGSAMLPIEDRYQDDGSVTGDDSKRFSLRSGRTRAMALDSFEVVPADDDPVLGHLVREMKSGRRKVVAALGGVAALCGALLLLAF